MSDAYTLIQNGLIIDGTGSAPFPGDVLIMSKRNFGDSLDDLAEQR